MERNINSLNTRKGRFLWMERNEQDLFVKNLKCKIAQGYYCSDIVFSKIAEDLAPVMADTVDER